MKQYECKKCGAVNDIELVTKGTQTGLYCKLCGTWIKWVGKDEMMFAEQIIRSNNSNEEQTKLNSRKTSAKQRVEAELVELVERKDKLFNFVGTSKYATLSTISKKLLFKQYSVMIDYIDILQERLNNWED